MYQYFVFLIAVVPSRGMVATVPASGSLSDSCIQKQCTQRDSNPAFIWRNKIPSN